MRLLFFLVINVYVLNVFANTDPDVDLFVKVVLQKEYMPTISDYHKFYGEGAEGELSLLTKYCKEKKWLPVNKNKDCVEYVKKQYSQKEKVESLYLKKLRRLLSLSPKKVTLKKIEIIKDKGALPHELLYVAIEDDNVVFFRPVGGNSKGTFGTLSISKINLVPVRELVKNNCVNK